ncbi:MAG: hypothetical protein ACRD4P_16880 [Bryobacteraceae bacterium]
MLNAASRRVNPAAAAIATLATIIAAVALGAIIRSTTPVEAWTSNTYQWVTEPNSGQKFMNHDNTAEPGWSTNVDWPIRFLFRQNATVNKVKNRLDGCGSDPSYTVDQVCAKGGDMHEQFITNTNFYDVDGGKKRGKSCASPLDEHMRFYAYAAGYDYNWNPTWGQWIVGSNHRDYEWVLDDPISWSCSTQYQSVEVDEDWWNQRIITFNGLISPAWGINTNTLQMLNAEGPMWGDANHYVASNGWGSIVWVTN